MSYNPWNKKNPFMSMWLSGANAMLGATRSQISAAMHRQANAAITESTKQMLAFWGINVPTQTRATKRRRRR